MIEDCLRDRPEGWMHLATCFVPVFRHLVRHYQPASDSNVLWSRFLRYLREDQTSPLRNAAPMSEREFVLEARDSLLAFAGVAPPEPEVDWEGFQAALEPFTGVEKQTVWFAVFGYDDPSAASLMRMCLETASTTRRRAEELLSERLPGFSIAEAGPTLHRLASESGSKDPIPVRQFLRAMDGQLSWSERKDLDRLVALSWYEVDRFCLAREADAATREANRMSSEAAAPILAAAGIPAPKKPRSWRLFAKS